jgi:Domain of Unknown Function (DUF928)
MNTVKLTGLVWLAALALAVPTFSDAQEKKDGQAAPRGESQPKAATTTTAAVPTYKPPLRGAPGGRIGGGTRGSGREVFVLTVLAPDHGAQTVSEQPSLYWFISRATSMPIELTLMDLRTTQPVLETRLAATTPGVHRIRLADHGVRLETGVPYRWFVTIVPDSNRRSKDLLAGGAIERVEPPAGLSAKIAQASKEETASLYADAGVWYEALAAISEQIDSAPNDAALRKQRATLLAQVGLTMVGEDGAATSR